MATAVRAGEPSLPSGLRGAQARGGALFRNFPPVLVAIVNDEGRKLCTAPRLRPVHCLRIGSAIVARATGLAARRRSQGQAPERETDRVSVVMAVAPPCECCRYPGTWRGAIMLESGRGHRFVPPGPGRCYRIYILSHRTRSKGPRMVDLPRARVRLRRGRPSPGRHGLAKDDEPVNIRPFDPNRHEGRSISGRVNPPTPSLR